MSLWAALGECRHKTHIHIVGIADSLRTYDCTNAPAARVVLASRACIPMHPVPRARMCNISGACVDIRGDAFRRAFARYGNRGEGFADVPRWQWPSYRRQVISSGDKRRLLAA